MSIISRYTLRQIGVPTLLAAGVIGFFLVGGSVRAQLTELLLRLPADQIRVFDISRISFFALPTLVGYIFPITFLLGIMFAFSRMAQHGEIIAMKAAGIPLKRVVLPVLAAGIVLSGVVFAATDIGRPWAYKRLMSLILSELPLRMTIDMLPTGSIQEYGGWRVYIGGREADGTLRNITLLQPAEDGGANAFYAKSAKLIRENGRPVLEMTEGYLVPSDPTRHITFQKLRQAVPTPETKEMPNMNDGMTMSELFRHESKLSKQWDETQALPVAVELRKARLKIKDRLAFPLMCLAIALVGAPAGARTNRTGRSYAFGMGLSIILVYMILRKALELPLLLTLGQTVALGQAPNMLLAVWGLWLLWRVDRV